MAGQEQQPYALNAKVFLGCIIVCGLIVLYVLARG